MENIRGLGLGARVRVRARARVKGRAGAAYRSTIMKDSLPNQVTVTTYMQFPLLNSYLHHTCSTL